MKLKWKRPPETAHDKAMKTNGAYQRPEVHTLVDSRGVVHARVQLIAGEWRYFMPNAAASPPMANITVAKDRAKAKALEVIRAKQQEAR